MAKSSITCTVPDTFLAEAKCALAKHDLTLSAAFRTFLKYVVDTGTLPMPVPDKLRGLKSRHGAIKIVFGQE